MFTEEEILHRAVYIRYDESLNGFYDIFDNRIVNILEFISSNDLYLFHNDPGYCVFFYRDSPEWIIEIFTED